jgi:predicted NBD/HSP70 family sugar kinase
MATASVTGSAGDVLELVRSGAVVTRSDVMEVTGLSRSTVMSRVGTLLAAGLVTETPEVGRAVTGRPPAALSFNERAGVVLAADLGARHGRLAVCSLAGEALVERDQPIRIADGPETILGWLSDTFDELLAEAGRNRGDVLALGVGVPGPVDVSTGRPVRPPIMPGWDRHPVAGELTTRFGAPTFVERDVNAMALGEHRTQWPDVRHMAFVKVGTGIGAGVITDGSLLRGSHGRAGDIGHLRAIIESDVLCTCGNRGCVGAVASGAAIIRQLGGDGIEASSTADVVALVNAGDARATHRLREAARLIGAALAAVVSVAAPSLIVVGGALAEASEPVLAGIRESVYQRSSSQATGDLRILTSRLGARAGVVGAATLALDNALSPESIDALLARREVVS